MGRVKKWKIEGTINGNSLNLHVFKREGVGVREFRLGSGTHKVV